MTFYNSSQELKNHQEASFSFNIGQVPPNMTHLLSGRERMHKLDHYCLTRLEIVTPPAPLRHLGSGGHAIICKC